MIEFSANIKTRSNNKKYKLFHIPKKVREGYSIKINEMFLISLENCIFYSKVCGSNDGSKYVNIPLKIANKLVENKFAKIKFLKKSIKPKTMIRIVKISSNLYLDMLFALSENQIHCKKKIHVFENKNSLMVTAAGNCKIVKIPRFILLDKEFFQVMGLYQ